MRSKVRCRGLWAKLPCLSSKRFLGAKGFRLRKGSLGASPIFLLSTGQIAAVASAFFGGLPQLLSKNCPPSLLLDSVLREWSTYTATLQKKINCVTTLGVFFGVYKNSIIHYDGMNPAPPGCINPVDRKINYQPQLVSFPDF